MSGPSPVSPDAPAPIGRTRGTGVSVALLLGLAVTVIVIVLALQNTENTTVEVFAGDYRAPLVVVILTAAVAGIVLDEIAGLVWRHRRRRRLADRAELRELRRQR